MSQTNQYNKNFDLIRESKAEADRLDVLNARLRDYFGGRITMAPVDMSKVKSVLEVGAGSGAWTLDAATALPNEQIVACDIAPLPDAVTLPPNARFDIVDVTGPLPYEPNSFDLIHIRLLLVHVKGVPEILSRIVAL
ncbi:hypothetical protein PENSPDRAFT_648888 [Peniophora sp. CONT]|nr:hypothetical protein PENSPDRAFT_648888 [Peniophora sp. CONT]